MTTTRHGASRASRQQRPRANTRPVWGTGNSVPPQRFLPRIHNKSCGLVRTALRAQHAQASAKENGHSTTWTCQSCSCSPPTRYPHSQTPMANNLNTLPHRVFKISELARLVALELVLVSQESVASLACTCRYLEEPALSTLWAKQVSLSSLLKALPGKTLDCEDLGRRKCLVRRVGRSSFCGAGYFDLHYIQLRIVGDPLPAVWARLQRYASWMRQLWVEGGVALDGETVEKLRLKSPAGGWFPGLRVISWHVTKRNFPYAGLTFSPRLEKVFIFPMWGRRDCGDSRFIDSVASTISTIPASNLRTLILGTRGCEAFSSIPWEVLGDSLSSLVLRCGTPLEAIGSVAPLSDDAMAHLIRLPYLRTLHIEGPPPPYSASLLTLELPALKGCSFGEGAADGWVSLLKRLEGGVPDAKSTTPLFRMKESLRHLKIQDPDGLVIDGSFASLIRTFRNLVQLDVDVYCGDAVKEDRCTFLANDDDVTKLTAALPRLVALLLGHPCSHNTCATTVACLLPISVHCVELERLEIHLNTTDIAGDFRNVLEEPRFQKLRHFPRSPLLVLNVFNTPLALEGPDKLVVATGLVDAFPSLLKVDGGRRSWDDLSEMLPIE